MKLVLPELQGSGKWNRNIALLGPWLIFVAICGVIAALFSVVTTQGAGVSTGFTNGTFYCDTSDKIRFAYADNAFDTSSPYWDSNLFLSVTMGFHGLTFVQAKAIDICFDLIVGRGSQVLLALTTYSLLRRAVLRSMEVREFSLALVLPFFMERLSVYTLWAMVANMRIIGKKSEPTEQSARPRVRIDWRIALVTCVGCYILAIPTFLSAMTSYQARGEPYFPVDGGSSYMSAEHITIPNVIVKNGEQIGMPTNFPLYNDSDPQLYAAVTGYDEALKTQIATLWEEDWVLYKRVYSTAYSNAHTYVNAREHGTPSYLGKSEITKVLESEVAFNKTRDGLPLQQNITDSQNPPLWSITLWPRNATWGETPWFTYYQDCIDTSITIRNTTYDLDLPLSVSSNLDHEGNPASVTLFALNKSSTLLYGAQLAAIGICLPSKEYVWGFSSLMLFTFCMLTVAIMLLLIILHYDAYFNSMADRYKLHISPYRDILDLAGELCAHYGEAEVASMSATELDRVMQKDPATSRLETATLHKTRAARWNQGNNKRRMPTWKTLRKGSEVAESSSRTDAEESLMSLGRNAYGSEFEMGKLPAKAMTKQID